MAHEERSQKLTVISLLFSFICTLRITTSVTEQRLDIESSHITRKQSLNAG